MIKMPVALIFLKETTAVTATLFWARREWLDRPRTSADKKAEVIKDPNHRNPADRVIGPSIFYG